MKSEINLLPPAYQAERQTQLYLSRLGRILRRVDAVLILILAVLGLLYGTFHLIQSNLQQQRTIAQSTDAAVTQQINQTNAMVAAIQTRGVAYAAWTPHVKELLVRLPPELHLTRIEADENARTLVVSGTFRERDAVVQYGKAIEKLSWVEKIESPLQNLASGSQAEFRITITRKALAL